MSSFDPLDLGEHAQESYARYLIGGNQRGYQGLLEGFEATGDEDPYRQFIRSKGPFLEGVPAAAWSETTWTAFADSVDGAFAPNGLEQPIVDAFDDEGFEHLQRHQEEAINWLVDDKHALIAAGTGRGKTEAWFIPILQYALRAKRGKIDRHSGYESTIKAVITYPTKALAQDQLKRFVEYLWLVNEKSDLPSDQQLTIGVYDGDTPYRSWVPNDNKDPFTYLIDSFRHFELPSTIAKQTAIDEETLETVPPNVYVDKDPSSNEFRLKLKQEYGGHVLDFVHLTRDKMHEDPPDILLTNPDTINYRLFNVNDEQAHRMFVDQPKFLVFDEVHTYEGLFGSHVSMLVKRLRRLREERDIEDTLRIIAGSATIDEREVLFQRLFDIPTNERGRSYDLIEEVTPDDVSRTPGELPPALTEEYLDLRTNSTTAADGGVATSKLGLEGEGDLESQLKRAVADGELQCVEHLHKVLQRPDHEEYEIAPSPRLSDFVEYIHENYACSYDTAEIAAQNILDLFDIVGYEVRAHVMNWPVDGYYKCVHCHRIYSKPETCDCDGHEHRSSFVTKLRLCQDCGEQVYETWYCPDCGTVRPVTQETEGEYLYAIKPECNHPDHSELVRVYWTPEYRCEECGTIERAREGLDHCECDGALTRTSEGIECKNPTCTIEHHASKTACSACGGSLSVRDEVTYECSDLECERHENGEVDSQDGLECASCDSPLVPKYTLSWFCTDESHAGRHAPGTIPETCECGRSTFVLPVYIDTQEADYCLDCNADRSSDLYYFPGSGCTIEGHDSVERRYSSFSLRAAYRDSNGNVRLASPGKAEHVLPCYHGRSRNYDSLMRSPTNAGVTMSQFMLRDLADTHGSQEQAKMMSFADSYRDMERLANDFDEPERKLFIQQRILSYMSRVGSATVDELLSGTMEDARSYWEEMDASDDVINDVIGYGPWRGTVLSQLVPGTYLLYNGNISRRYGELVNGGYLDISFTDSPNGAAERAVCRELLEDNRQSRQVLLESLRESEDVSNPVSVLNDLKARNMIVEDEEYDRVELDLKGLTVHYVGPDHAIEYDSRRDSFVSTAWQEADGGYTGTVPFDVPYTDRSTPSSPYFDRTAYRTAETSPRLLLSQVYKGDVPADVRRRIEHEFKHDPVPNFLSTGPAMEIGIDIGDLNTLLLMGTPPNTNAYLQRIGRAGRDAGKSLVTTVSKRNPIDFYYHKKPEKLISSGEKPIPLDQHNESVLRISLTWAIMDYIAARYHIPWKRADLVEGQEITKPDPSEWDRYRKEEPRSYPPSDYQRFTQLYHRPVEQINHGSVFEVLAHIVEHDEGVRVWLEDLLEYVYCRNCNHIFDTAVSGSCPECSEDALRRANEEFEELIADVLEGFERRLVLAAYNYRSELESDQRELEEQIDHLEDALGGSGQFGGGGFSDLDSDDSDEETERELGRLKVQRDMVRDLISDYQNSSFSDIHGRSAVSQFVPQLRAFSDSVTVTRRERDSQGTIRAESKSAWDRDAAMALRELHPYAYVLRSKQGYVVTRVSRDTEGTRALQEQSEGAKLRCRKCGYTGPWAEQSTCPDEQCDAGPDRLSKVEPIAIGSVELTAASIEENGHDVTDVYPLSGYSTNPRSTFAHVSTDIPDFEVERTVSVTGPDGEPLFTVEYGGIDIVELTTSFTTSYDDEQKDPREQPLRICQHGGCGSVVVPGADGSERCLTNPGHDPAKQAEVMVGRTFATKGIRVTGDSLPSTVLHTLAHGFRLALQRTGGVDIRSLQESYEEGEDAAHVFESAVGGNGVTDLLFQREEGIYVELLDALTVMYENIDGCDCVSGCPECLYQYGCSERNRNRTLSKDLVRELLGEILEQDEEEIFTG